MNPRKTCLIRARAYEIIERDRTKLWKEQAKHSSLRPTRSAGRIIGLILLLGVCSINVKKGDFTTLIKRLGFAAPAH
jgi:hypothetical protein